MNAQGKLVVMANIKGGTGKSTLAVNLAAIAANNDKTVLLIDTDDPQFNVASWAATRMESGIKDIKCTQHTTATLQQIMPDYLKIYDYVIIDCGGRNSNVMRSAMIAAAMHNGILIVPLTTSPFDIWASIDTIEKIQEVKSMMPTKAYFVLNRIITGTKLEKETQDALKELEEKYDISSLKTSVYQRVDMINCLKTGLSVVEIARKGEAANEMQEMFDEINKKLTDEVA